MIAKVIKDNNYNEFFNDMGYSQGWHIGLRILASYDVKIRPP